MPLFRHCRYGAALVLAAMVMAGCRQTSAAQEFPQIPSSAISQAEPTALGRVLAPQAAAHPGESGFRLLTKGSESFAMRLALVQAAEKTLDLQYYSIHDDTTANLLLEAVVRAAQRGVRIRFLLDDISLHEVASTFSVLDEFKNVEIRVFNPFVTRDDGPLTRMFLLLTDLKDIDRRMHNKALISDNQMVIIGGRNLGDEYFEANTDVTFKDLDLLIAGPMTAQISRSFDSYWNSKEALPIGQLEKPGGDPASLGRIRRELAAHWDEVRNTPEGKKLLDSRLTERLTSGDAKLLWSKAELAADEPRKVSAATPPGSAAAASKPMQRLESLVGKATGEVVIISPYLVPGADGVEWLADLVKHGVRVKVITNSLASTDVVAVHTGYKNYREALVRSGIELYEMKPIEGERPRQRLIGSSAPARASLHAKAYVVDRKNTMIGSFNLDPRSVHLNTEIAVVTHNPAIAQQVVAMFDDVTSPQNSYHVVYDAIKGKLVWKTAEKGKAAEYGAEPQAGFWRPVESGVMSLLPIEKHL